MASSFDKYIEALSPIKDKLPVIDSEIGDTWIQGIASDPRKMAEYRAVSRAMKACMTSGMLWQNISSCLCCFTSVALLAA